MRPRQRRWGRPKATASTPRFTFASALIRVQAAASARYSASADSQGFRLRLSQHRPRDAQPASQLPRAEPPSVRIRQEALTKGVELSGWYSVCPPPRGAATLGVLAARPGCSLCHEWSISSTRSVDRRGSNDGGLLRISDQRLRVSPPLRERLAERHESLPQNVHRFARQTNSRSLR